jgi:hypothetical protein
VDFNYVDTSGEVLDQRAEHEVRLSVFMSALKDDLAAGGKFRVLVPACRPDPCSRSSGSELLKAANAAGADFLMVGGIHKMSTLVQWVKAELIDLRSGQILLDKLFTFRGDTDRSELRIRNAGVRRPIRSKCRRICWPRLCRAQWYIDR